MHELSITQDVVRTVVEHTDGRTVAGVRLRIGALAGIVPDAVRFCFDLATQGTTLEGAWLEIADEPGRGGAGPAGTSSTCRSCCPGARAGARTPRWWPGRSLVVTSVEVV